MDRHTFLTSRPIGGLQLWDTRQGARPTLTSPATFGHTGCPQLDDVEGANRQITSLRVHPARPSLCATGGSCGSAAVWDLRFQRRPLVMAAAAAGSQVAGCSGGGRPCGDVVDVHFDASGSETVLFATADGHVAEGTPVEVPSGSGSAWPSELGAVNSLMHRKSESFAAMDVAGSYAGQDILCAGDMENLVYVRR